MLEKQAVRDMIVSLLPTAEEFLRKLVAFPSLPGEEHDAMLFLEHELAALGGDVSRVPMTDSLKKDPEYSWPIQDIAYDGRFNLRFERKGSAPGPTLIFNAHVDVVPPSDGMMEPWKLNREGDTLYGRGACDDKGPLAAVYLALLALEKLDIDVPGNVVLHIVNEEENGGNGTLAMIRTNEKADGCIVMEPSAGKLFTSIRGAVWFRIHFRGTSGHSGQAGKTRSALGMARKAMDALEHYHSSLLRESRGIPLFDEHPYPMPLTFGKLHAGNWPAAAPGEALLEGVLGFLPNKTRDAVCKEMHAALVSPTTGLKADDFELQFTYRHDCSVIDPSEPLPASVLSAASHLGVPLEPAAFPASCDAWFYSNILGIPTVVYGPGDLKFAHSSDEQINLHEIGDSAAVLLQTMATFCRQPHEAAL